MPDDNRFAGLSDADDEEADGEAEPESTEQSPVDDGGPAFEFDETDAKSIYVRPETLETLEDAEFEVEMVLRSDHRIRDVTGREFHDAAVHVLAEHADEIVDRILDERESE